MYTRGAFAVESPEALTALIETYNFATLISQTQDGLTATHVPMLLDAARGPHGTLVTHLARNNPHAHALDGADALVVFPGPHAYVSPSLYTVQLAVPTWNYATVHVHGKARVVNEPQPLLAMLKDLVRKHETGRAAPWSMEGLPPVYIDRMLRGIVGIEIEIARIDGKHKLSQNRNRDDRLKVIAGLNESESPHDRELAAYMTAHAPPP